MIKRFQTNELKIIPLGGCEEVGRNMTVFEYGNDIVILDMGIQFPEQDMPGINYVIPNVKYLRGKEKNIRAVIFSHGHLDHIGAAPILLPKLGNPPVIARPFTIEMLKYRQEDYSKGSSKKLKTTYIKNIKDKINLGDFKVSFFAVDHAIMDAVGVILETGAGTVIHPGDWMMEHKPIARRKLKYTQLSNLPKPTILMLESIGSTNSKKPITEEEMIKNLKKIINNAPGRVIIATFSSQIERIKQILEHASNVNKKAALDGFSMKVNIEIARKLGYIKLKKDVMIPINKADNYPDNKVIMLVTGAQGEEKAVLPRIVNNEHRFVKKIRKTDTVVFSSSVIPGHEKTIQRFKDKLYRLSDNIIHSDIMDVHISGHSNIEDIKKIIRQIKPTYFVPVYANHYLLKEAAKIAYKLGYKENKVIVPDNGSIIKTDRKSLGILKDKAPTDYVFVDGSGVGDVGDVVLKDRQRLADDGMFVIVAVVDKKTGKVKGSPDIISRGFIYLRESKELLFQTRKKAIGIINSASSNGNAVNPVREYQDNEKRQSSLSSNRVNWNNVKKEVKDKLTQFLFSKTERKPIIIPVIIEV